MKIMCFGDSITDGFWLEGGYRTFLCNKLEESGLSQYVDFVGKKESGSGYDNQHEGYTGYSIERITESITGSRTGLKNVAKRRLEEDKPDVVTLMVGTNDILSHYELDTAGERLEGLVDLIYEYLPDDGMLFLATIPCMDANDTTYIDAGTFTVEYMDECVDFIRKETGKDKINLLGVCQGGTFSTIYTALHQEKIKNLVAMVVPIDFSSNDGLLFRWSRFMNIDSLIDAYGGVVPGDVMNVAYLILKPLTLTLDKYVNMTDKWADAKYLSNFIRMEKWTFDSPAQVGATLSQFIKDLYQDNKLIKGELELGGQKVDLKSIKIPVLCACADKDHLVPLSASEPLMDAIGSTDKEFKHFKTGHIGMYTSSKAEPEFWPSIVNWLKERSK